MGNSEFEAKKEKLAKLNLSVESENDLYDQEEEEFNKLPTNFASIAAATLPISIGLVVQLASNKTFNIKADFDLLLWSWIYLGVSVLLAGFLQYFSKRFRRRYVQLNNSRDMLTIMEELGLKRGDRNHENKVFNRLHLYSKIKVIYIFLTIFFSHLGMLFTVIYFYQQTFILN